jgi:PHP family Zn ribbon phosphoesterase
MSAGCRLEPVVTLACTSCQLVYTLDPAGFGSGNTGCPRCGGWTWIAQLISAARAGGGQR